MAGAELDPLIRETRLIKLPANLIKRLTLIGQQVFEGAPVLDLRVRQVCGIGNWRNSSLRD